MEAAQAFRGRVDTDDASKRAYNEAATASERLMLAEEWIEKATLRVRFNNFCDNNNLAKDGEFGASLLCRYGITATIKRGPEYRTNSAGREFVYGFLGIDLVTVGPPLRAPFYGRS